MFKQASYSLLILLVMLVVACFPAGFGSQASAQGTVEQSEVSLSEEFPRATSCNGLAFSSTTVIDSQNDLSRVEVIYETAPGEINRYAPGNFAPSYRFQDIQCNEKSGKVLVVYSLPDLASGHTYLEASMYDMQNLAWNAVTIPFLGVTYGWPQVEAISDGFLISFAYYTGGANGQEIRGIIVGANGSVSDSFTILTQAPYQFVHDLTCESGGLCVVATQSGGSQIRMALWSKDGIKPIDLTPTGSYPLVSFDGTGRILLMYHTMAGKYPTTDPMRLTASDAKGVLTPTANYINAQVFENGNWSPPQILGEGYTTDVFKAVDGMWMMAFSPYAPSELGPFHVDLINYSEGAFRRSNLATVDSPGGDYMPAGHFPFREGKVFMAYSHIDGYADPTMEVEWLEIDYLWESFLPTAERN